MEYNVLFKNLSELSPSAVATIRGGTAHPNIYGKVYFYQINSGVIVMADIENLPVTDTNIFAFHIHEGDNCENDFANTGSHYNPANLPHPNHAGDMPPLFSNNGDAWFCFFTRRFKINEIIGRTVVIHDSPDDFTTQPAGNSGKKIACGVIETLKQKTAFMQF